jgi:hypothetical protein
MPIVVAAAMYGTLFPAPDPQDPGVPSERAVRDWNHGGEFAAPPCPRVGGAPAD